MGQGDDYLLSRIRLGDVNAMAGLYDCYAPLIYSLSLHILKDARQAEQITQDILVNLWRNPPPRDSTQGLEVFLKAEAVTRAFQMLNG